MRRGLFRSLTLRSELAAQCPTWAAPVIAIVDKPWSLARLSWPVGC